MKVFFSKTEILGYFSKKHFSDNSTVDKTFKYIVGTPYSPPTPYTAEKYVYTNNPEFGESDAVGFTATIGNLSGKSVNTLTWYIKKTDYKELTSGTIPTISGEGTVNIGFIVYDLPEGVTADNISAGYTFKKENIYLNTAQAPPYNKNVLCLNCNCDRAA